MADLLFALNAVCPIVLTVVIGYFLKRIGLFPKELAKPLNKIVFRVLLPSMLFNNIYTIKGGEAPSLGYILFVVIAIVAAFILSLPLSGVITKQRSRRAVIIQAFYRSNYALIGIPLASSIMGAEATASATLLSAVSIPVLNVLSVVALTVFAPIDDGHLPTLGATVKKTVLGIITNPLVLSILAGLAALGIRAILTSQGIVFSLYEAAPPVEKVINYLGGAATPIALLTLGAQFEFSNVGNMKREIIAGTVIRTFITPAVAISAALLFPTFNAGHFATFIGMFATPLAVSTVPMAQEMGSDSELAGQLVIFTTLASGFGVFLFTYLLRVIGVF